MSGTQRKTKALTSRLLQPEIQKYISNRSFVQQEEYQLTTGIVNKSGFIYVLPAGFKSRDKETLEINVNQIDLSIQQNGGFSLFFWFITSKSSSEQQVCYLLKKGASIDQFTPTISLINSQKNLVVSLITSTSKKENIYAHKEIEIDHLYSVAVTFLINYQEENTEVSVYLDGKLDTQSTIPGEPIHNQGSVYLGKPDSTSHGFKGVIAEIVIIPGVIVEDQIKRIHQAGLQSMSDSRGTNLETVSTFVDVFERVKLINKYAYHTKKPVADIINLNLPNQKMKEIVKIYDEEERKNDVVYQPILIDYKEERMIDDLKAFLSDEDNEIKVRKILDKAKDINTILFLANKGEESLTVERIGKIFEVLTDTLRMYIDTEFIRYLGKLLNAVKTVKTDSKTNPKKDLLDRTVFFTNLERISNKIEEEQARIDAENAKYQPKKSKKKNAGGTIKSLYQTKKTTKTLNSKDTIPQQNAKTFTYCIPEHENLLLKTQKNQNIVDKEQQEELQNYQSSFIIKKLYERPKNLPAENPSKLGIEILDNSDSRIETKLDDEEAVNENTIPVEVQKELDDMVTEIFKEEGHLFRQMHINNIITQSQVVEANMLINDIIKEEEKSAESEQAQQKVEDLEGMNVEDQEKEKKTTVVAHSFDPDPPKGWSDGVFELIINHCYDCHNHKTTTKHFEYFFVDKFNEIGAEVKKLFPNSIVRGNLEYREYLGNFDVYLRGTGLPSEDGKYFIYRKKDTLKFPTVDDILDKLVALSIMYGSSMNVEKAQLDDMEMIKLPITHDFPYDYNDRAAKEKEKHLFKKSKEQVDPDRTKFVCLHWGCGKEFTQTENLKKDACTFHPGVWIFGSERGNWTGGWSCCGKKWESEGCRKGQHDGVLPENRTFLCFNCGGTKGAIIKDNKIVGYGDARPDSLCGEIFTMNSTGGCSYHSGRLNLKGVFDCCGNDKDSAGCQSGEHKSAVWPDVKAKLYFYPKYTGNPGLQFAIDNNKEVVLANGLTFPKGKKLKKSDIRVALMKSCPFWTENTKHFATFEEIHAAREARKTKEIEELRFCQNVGCKKHEYIEKNNSNKACRCHPGKWDWGSTGTTCEQYINGRFSDNKKENRIMWGPHWTCCGKEDWEAEPCTTCRHNGRLLDETPEEDKQNLWPDYRYQLKYRKIVSGKADKFREPFVLTEHQIKEVFKKMTSPPTLDSLPGLCDRLRLNYILIQENPSYTMKFYDVVNKNRSVNYFFDKGGFNTDKFIKWWFMDYSDIFNEMPDLANSKDKKKDENK